MGDIAQVNKKFSSTMHAGSSNYIVGIGYILERTSEVKMAKTKLESRQEYITTGNSSTCSERRKHVVEQHKLLVERRK